MNCGQAIMVKDFWGSYRLRFIAQCEGRWLMISSNPAEYRNGYLLADWRGVLREMVAITVPAKMLEKACSIEATGTDGLYLGFGLTYPLSVASLAALFSVAADDVRGELADLAVAHEV